jgi:hypothetical protein
MDRVTFDDFLFLFALALPLSVFFWAILFPATGLLNDPDDHSRIVSFCNRAGFLPDSDRARLVIAVLGLVAVNLVPSLYLVRPVTGTPTPVIVGYFLAQGVWVAILVIDVSKARSRSRDR